MEGALKPDVSVLQVLNAAAYTIVPRLSIWNALKRVQTRPSWLGNVWICEAVECSLTKSLHEQL